MSCRLTVVVDNRAPAPLAAEHGFALQLATAERTILFDTGQDTALMTNMAQLGIDPRQIDTLVLSHGHYDHTGGVAWLLEHNPNLDIYLHSAVFQPRYSLDGESPAIVRMGFAAMEAITRHPESRVHWLTRPTRLTAAIGITGPIARANDFEDAGGPFFLDPEGQQADIIRDDVAVWLHTPAGLVIVLGCCHAGLINTLEYITTRTGEKRIALIIGGLHLLHSSGRRLERTVRELGRFAIRKIVACHCSGEQAVKYLADHLAAEVGFGQAGLVIDL